jgi:hypothetical protein
LLVESDAAEISERAAASAAAAGAIGGVVIIRSGSKRRYLNLAA